MYRISSITVDNQNMSSAVGIAVFPCKEISHSFWFGSLSKGGEKGRYALQYQHPRELGVYDKCYCVWVCHVKKHFSLFGLRVDSVVPWREISAAGNSIGSEPSAGKIHRTRALSFAPLKSWHQLWPNSCRNGFVSWQEHFSSQQPAALIPRWILLPTRCEPFGYFIRAPGELMKGQHSNCLPNDSWFTGALFTWKRRPELAGEGTVPLQLSQQVFRWERWWTCWRAPILSRIQLKDIFTVNVQMNEMHGFDLFSHIWFKERKEKVHLDLSKPSSFWKPVNQTYCLYCLEIFKV